MKSTFQVFTCLSMFAAGPTFSSVTYVHTDHLGSVVAESDAAGAITERFHYKPFGETIETQQDDVGYAGHKYDSDLDLTYMQARYYDAAVGRFYGTDPVGFSPNTPMSFNRYSYAYNNPYKYNDPDGELPQFLAGALIGGAWGLGTSLVVELRDWKGLASVGNIARSTSKGALVGGVTATAGIGAGALTAAALGGVDGAVTTAMEGGTTGEIIADGAASMIIEGGATYVGGAAAQKFIGPSLKQDLAAELAITTMATGAQSAVNFVPEAVDATSNSLQDAARGASTTVDRLEEMLRPKDPTRDN